MSGEIPGHNSTGDSKEAEYSTDKSEMVEVLIMNLEEVL
jgi:hypothetical protein